MNKVFTVTLTVNGKRKYYRGHTLAEAELKREKDRLLLSSAKSMDIDMTFGQLTYKWFHTYKAGKLHTRSEETIRGILNRYVLPELADEKVRDIKPIDIQKLMNSVSHLSLSTQRKVLQYTKGILQVAVDNDLLAKLPITMDIKPRANTPDEVVPLTDEQVETLLTATKGTRVYPFLIVLRYAGLRKGEALGLMWRDIDFDERVINVERSIVYTEKNRDGEINTELKTSASRRRVPMNQKLYEVLKAEKEKSNSLYVFSKKDGKYLSEASFRKMWDIISYRQIGKHESTHKKQLERTIDFDVHPHLLRHTCITAWIEQGLDVKEVQRLAGHSTPDITMKIYTHYREKQRWEETKAKIVSC